MVLPFTPPFTPPMTRPYKMATHANKDILPQFKVRSIFSHTQRDKSIQWR